MKEKWKEGPMQLKPDCMIKKNRIIKTSKSLCLENTSKTNGTIN